MWRTAAATSAAAAARVGSAAARGLADVLQRVADLARGLGPCELRGHEDAYQASVLDDGKSPDLAVGHHARRLGGVVAHDDVAIGHDAHELPVTDDGERAAVLLLHERRGLGAGILGPAGDRLGGHELTYFHGCHLRRSDRRSRNYAAAPILKIFVPQTGQRPWVAGRPFFIVTCLASLISREVLHFTQ